MSNQPLFSIIIPAYNEADYLAGCLQSIQSQAVDFSYEIIVVDNGSTDNTAQLARQFGVQVVSEPKLGVGRARRTGTALARGKYILHLDADTRLPADYLANVLRQFEQNQKLACLGGQFLFYDAPKWKNILRFGLLPLYVFLARLISWGKLGVIGNNMSFKKELYDQTNGFDPKLKFAEDGDLCRQLSAFGQIKVDSRLRCYASVRRFKVNKHLLTLFYNCLKVGLNRPSNYNFPHSREL